MRLYHAAALCLAIAATTAFSADSDKWYESRGDVKIIQVVSDTEVILEFDQSGGPDGWIWIQGMDTSGFVDGKRYVVNKHFKYVGTKRYTTVLGAAKTVQLMRPENAEDRKEKAAAEKAEKEREKAELEKNKARWAARKKEREAEEKERPAREAEQKKAQDAAAVARKLKRAQSLLTDALGKNEKEAAVIKALAVRYLREIIKEAPKSTEAKTAQDLLNKVDK